LCDFAPARSVSIEIEPSELISIKFESMNALPKSSVIIGDSILQTSSGRNIEGAYQISKK
jgi:hypothetical protein